MAPPRSFDPASSGAPRPSVEEYDAICEELAATQGLINVAEARMMELAADAIAIGVSGGTNLTAERWMEWRAGIAPGRAADIVRVAKRRGELPHTMAALALGELTLDQVAEVARYVPARYDESAARVAQCCTVRQLRQALPWYRDPRSPSRPKPGSDEDLEAQGSVSTGYDERGYFAHIRLPEARGAIVDRALKAMHEDLKRQAKADASATGSDLQPVYAADALVAMAEGALRAGEAPRPGTDRYLVHVHLEAGADGLELATHLGIVIPDGQRRHLLCDASLRGIVRDGLAPLGAGRVTRVINRRLRRAIEHRDRGCCTVPGCGRTTGLEIHHLWHWEDGGPTETWNLITLCSHHHTSHHQGSLGIEGNADLPRHTVPGVVFTNAWNQPLDAVGRPIVPTPPAPGTDPSAHVERSAAEAGIAPHRYVPPTGERLDRSGFHLHPDPLIPGPEDEVSAGEQPPPDAVPPPPDVTGQRPPGVPPAPTSPTEGTPIDPTRAGPDAA
ncbi:DUF222 domain-containing protein [Aquihabitans sp. McL0605]|uniref:HNH endonuclease signature motif containing protein n=1 Tax=Aquihabitans sp. McL0605 TaxID=3415671 RepID=UPI003CF0A805